MNETLQPLHLPGRPGRTIVRPRLLLGATIAAAVLVVGCGGSSSKTSAVAVTPTSLRTLAVTLKQPIYWVGPAANVTYERTTRSTGAILLRYLPTGTKPGTGTPYLTVGTYKLADAYAATQRAASRPDAVRLEASAGAIAFSTKARPLNAWITYPGSRYQIEVFDPSPGRARLLVASGKVAPVPGSPGERGRPVAISAARLAQLAAEAEQPVYWAGPRSRWTYELTQTTRGWFLIRYLPAGAAAGITTPTLTIGTYPVAHALAAIKRLGRAKGATLIKLPGGGLAVSSPHFPHSVYLAYPGSNYEVEVFDPSLARARQLVTSGQIVAVS
jgi:hypothetical protein